jgi:hypothetical protein
MDYLFHRDNYKKPHAGSAECMFIVTTLGASVRVIVIVIVIVKIAALWDMKLVSL